MFLCCAPGGTQCGRVLQLPTLEGAASGVLKQQLERTRVSRCLSRSPRIEMPSSCRVSGSPRLAAGQCACIHMPAGSQHEWRTAGLHEHKLLDCCPPCATCLEAVWAAVLPQAGSWCHDQGHQLAMRFTVASAFLMSCWLASRTARVCCRVSRCRCSSVRIAAPMPCHRGRGRGQAIGQEAGATLCSAGWAASCSCWHHSGAGTGPLLHR